MVNSKKSVSIIDIIILGNLELPAAVAAPPAVAAAPPAEAAAQPAEAASPPAAAAASPAVAAAPSAGAQPSALLTTRICGANPSACLTKIFDIWSKTMLVNGEETTLNIWEMRDTENTVETEWSISSVDFVVLCFSLTDRTSYDRVTETWIPFLKVRAANIPIILIGTESDAAIRTITTAQGRTLAYESAATAYAECDCDDERSVQAIVNIIGRLM
nr:rac-like GTP-binding protein RAC9 [Nicotiana tomentosiformis]